MQLSINGKTEIFCTNISLQEIIQTLKIENKIMAVAVNNTIVKKEHWNSFIPNNQDKIEFLQFVGGG